MSSRITRTFVAFFFVLFVAISASAAPDGRNESGDWLFRRINRIVHQLKNIFAVVESDPVPPHP
jgi:hypothetical protein